MITSKQEIFTFRGATPEQVDDLCELWKEAVIDCNRRTGYVRVLSDAAAIDQFLVFYELYDYFERNPETSHDTQRTPTYH